jgi:hypothetical protein
MGEEILEKTLPLDKSHTINIGVLDLLHGYDDTIRFLVKQTNLSDDLKALYKATLDWKSGNDVFVGESGSLLRRLQFASWKYNLNKTFIKKGTLLTRDICNDPAIINLPLEELLELKLDNGTSQWLSSKIIAEGNWACVTQLERKNIELPYKLKSTRDDLRYWTIQRAQGNSLEPKYDETIKNQAQSYIELLQGKRPNFISEQAEDYCFAKVFKYNTKEFESLKSHESNRIKAMEYVIKADYKR